MEGPYRFENTILDIGALKILRHTNKGANKILSEVYPMLWDNAENMEKEKAAKGLKALGIAKTAAKFLI